MTQFDQKRTSELSHVGLKKRETPCTRVTSVEKAGRRTEERKSDKILEAEGTRVKLGKDVLEQKLSAQDD